MGSAIQIFLIFLHTLIAWFGVEWFFNRFHHLSRASFVLWHYIVVFISFFLVFLVFFNFFAAMSIMATTVLSFISILIIEFIVFRLLYSGEVWFFNFVDWFIPVGLATLAVSLAGMLS